MCSSMAVGRGSAEPAPSTKTPASAAAKTRWHLSGTMKRPSSSTNLRPFHSRGLWLEVTMTPPTAWCCWTITWTVGVGTIPHVRTRQPQAFIASTAACSTHGPLTRESRPRMKRGFPGFSRSCVEQNARTYLVTTSLVSETPAIPRIPERVTISGASVML